MKKKETNIKILGYVKDRVTNDQVLQMVDRTAADLANDAPGTIKRSIPESILTGTRIIIPFMSLSMIGR